MRRRTRFVLGALLLAVVPVGSSPLAAAATNAPIQVLHRADGSVTSTNWSGYAVADETFTSVQGGWVEPSATCTSTNSAAAFWVGIDGYDSDSVEQLGTDADCSGGSPSYYAWYEMYPAASVTLSKSSYPVTPGDHLAARVVANGSQYTLAMRDTAASGGVRWTFQTTQSSTVATDASAEWVAEAPSECLIIVCRVLPLTDFGSVTFVGAQATGNGAFGPISSFSDNNSITMETSGGTVKASPSGLNSTGMSFTSTWHSS